MTVFFPCGSCGKRLKIDPKLCVGRVVHCPACHAPLRISPRAADNIPYAQVIEPRKPPEPEPSYSLISAAPPPTPQADLWVHAPEPVKKKKRKLTKDERLLVEDTHWVVRYLHWVLLLALVPLLVTLVRGDLDINIEERVQRTLDQLPDGMREQVKDVTEDGNDEETLFRELPGHKLAGALFPRQTWAHWIFAFAAGAGYLFFFIVLCQRGTAQPSHLVYAGLFTATVGVLLLLIVQGAAMVSRSPFFVAGPMIMFLWIFKVIGASYEAALNPGSSFFLSFFGFTFGVGLCEELCKVIPVLCYLKWNKNVNWHGTFLWGLASGAGFGISEGIFYSSQMYNGVAGLGVYLERFVSVVALHALWSGCVGITLYLTRGTLKETQFWLGKVGIVLLACLPSMILHGLYDTFLKKEMAIGGLVVAVLSFGFLAILNHFLHTTGGVSLLRATRRSVIPYS